MSITPGEMLESAEVLIKGASEIDYRNSVSRAYYSAMHEAQARLPQERPESEFRGSSHGALIASLKAFFRMPTSARQQGASVAANLAAMKGAGTVADDRFAAAALYAKSTPKSASEGRMMFLRLVPRFENCARTTGTWTSSAAVGDFP